MDFEKDEQEIEWTKEDAEGKPAFDFDAFLGADNLDDRVTSALDGKDLLHPDAYGEFAPDYVPRRPGSGEHGRHEAPAPEGEDEEEEEPGGSGEAEEPEEEEVGFDPNDPRYAAPERPHVVVAEPRKKVYVDPVGEDYEPPKPPKKRRRRRGLRAVLVLLVLVLIALAVLLALNGRQAGGDTPRPTNAAPATPTQPAATSTPAPRTPTYSITVTAGSGGSVSPSGVVTVEQGKSASFTITPNSGYVLSQLLVDGSAVGTDSSYTFSNVTANHTIYAVFVAETTPTPPPTAEPTAAPTEAPTATPAPTAEPTPAPTPEPTPEPTPTEPPPVVEIPVDPAAEIGN